MGTMYMLSPGILVNDRGEDSTNGALPSYPRRSCSIVERGQREIHMLSLRLHLPPSFRGIIFFPQRMTYPPPSPPSSTPSPPRCWGEFFLVAIDEGWHMTYPLPLFYCIYPLNNRGILPVRT